MTYWNSYINKQIITILMLFISFVIGLLLTILPLPCYSKWWMPNWFVLLLIYWMVFMPKLVGLIFTFLLGAVIDLLLGNIVGTTSLCLLPVAFLADLLCYKFRTFSILQQFLMVAVLVGISQLIRLWIQLYINRPPNDIIFWINVPVSTFMWPLLCVFLHALNKVIKFC